MKDDSHKRVPAYPFRVTVYPADDTEDGKERVIVHDANGIAVCRMGGNVTQARFYGVEMASLFALAPGTKDLNDALFKENARLREALKGTVSALEEIDGLCPADQENGSAHIARNILDYIRGLDPLFQLPTEKEGG